MRGTSASDGAGPNLDDADLETLRNAFVEAFNARDLDAILELVTDDIETPEQIADGREPLAEELQAIWERSPATVLTQASVDAAPVAVAWLPDERGQWCRVAMVTFDDEEGRLTVIELPDDTEALERALAEDPIGDHIDEELDWSEWDRGEASGDGDGDWHETQLRIPGEA